LHALALEPNAQAKKVRRSIDLDPYGLF